MKEAKLCVLLTLATATGLMIRPAAESVAAAEAQVVLDSYQRVEGVDALSAQLRKETAEAKSHSFSRAWFDWELLLRRYIDQRRTDRGALKMLAAYFRGAVLDRYRALEARGEGHLFYVFNTSLEGDRSKRIFQGKTLQRDVHGGGSHGGWGSHARMMIFQELVERGLLTEEEQALFRRIVVQSLSERFLDFNGLERGANNRPYKNAGGIAAAVRVFPDLPRAQQLRAWIDRQWRELTEHGDIFEVNHFPYGGLHLSGLMDIAQQTGKIKQPEHRRLVCAIAKRYLLFNHGMGVRGNPNSAAESNARFTQEEVFANPWHATYYGDKLVPDFWYRAAKEFGAPEFLWAAVQTSIGPEPPQGTVSHQRRKQWQAAYQRRFQWFVRHGIEAKCPAGGSGVSLLCPTTHRIKERLYLCSGRRVDRPFASFYLYDRNNEYMHCFDDAMGRLYEYCVDGAKLIGSSGKYNGIFIGQSYYDMLMVRHPADAFPLHAALPEHGWANHAFLDQTAGVWRRASCSLPDVTHSRTGPDSDNWRYRPEIHQLWAWRRRDDPVGGAAANMDGLVYLNNQYTLRSVTLRFNGAPVAANAEQERQVDTVFVRNLRLAGPKGDVVLAKFDKRPKDFNVLRRKRSDTTAPWQELAAEISREVAEIAAADGAEVLRVNVEPGYEYAVRVGGFEHDFNLAEEYTRVGFDFKGLSTDPFLRYRQGWRYGQTNPPALVSDMVLNDRTIAPSHDVRGGILQSDSVRAEDHQGDSFGSFTYRNYFGAHATWTRDAVLTGEGYLVVRDVYTAGSETHGYRAGPVWCLRADGEWIQGQGDDGRPWRKFQNAPPDHDGRRNWFHAPAFDHAWWQKQQKRVLVYIHPAEDRTYGQLQHPSTPDFSRHVNTNSSWAASVVNAGRPSVFLSVLVPFDEGEDAAALAGSIHTRVGSEGRITAKIGMVRVSFGKDGTWSVQR